MTQILDTIFEKGAFRPLKQDAPPFAEGQHVQIAVETESFEEERDSWRRFALHSLARAYGDDEPEYGLDDIIELNPDYAGG